MNSNTLDDSAILWWATNKKKLNLNVVHKQQDLSVNVIIFTFAV